MTDKADSIRRFTRTGRVLLSAEEHWRSKRRDRKVLGIEDFTPADADAIRQAAPSTASAAFDHELTPDA